MTLTLKIGITFGLVMIFYSEKKVLLFLDRLFEAYQIASNGIPYFAIGFIFFAINIIYISYFQSIEESKKATLFTTVRGYRLLIVSFYLSPMILGIKGLWLAIPLAERSTFIIRVLALWINKIAKTKTALFLP